MSWILRRLDFWSLVSDIQEEQMGRQGYSAEFRRKVLDRLAEGHSVASVAHDLDVSD